VKNTIKVLIVALTTLAFSGLSFAQAKPTRITGEVTSVDATAGTLTVKTKDKDINLTADSNAKGALGKVKVGDMVKVTYAEKDGKMLASSIAGVKAKKSAKATAK
jgi:hypothetical protein